jgi:hypothetical protein|tara:strand:- start:41 stop:364 length:324 start_codon:yes stop_codon:yes gene_type:complete
MSHYAKVVDGMVTRVMVAEPEFIDIFVDDSPGTWIQTYKDGSQRKHYAGVGFKYDKTLDAFIPPSPYPSWTLNETTCLWEPPVAAPSDGNDYQWNEETTSWDQVTES